MPLFTHDCDRCIYLGIGTFGPDFDGRRVDLYVCQNSNGTDCIYRDGHDEPSYGSFPWTAAMEHAVNHPDGVYAQIVRLAVGWNDLKHNLRASWLEFLNSSLNVATQRFDADGGRGVDLAERIDRLLAEIDAIGPTTDTPAEADEHAEPAEIVVTGFHPESYEASQQTLEFTLNGRSLRYEKWCTLQSSGAELYDENNRPVVVDDPDFDEDEISDLLDLITDQYMDSTAKLRDREQLIIAQLVNQANGVLARRKREQVVIVTLDDLLNWGQRYEHFENLLMEGVNLDDDDDFVCTGYEVLAAEGPSAVSFTVTYEEDK